MLWTDHGLMKNEKSSVHLSSCGKNSGKKEAHEQRQQGEKKLLPLSEERAMPIG